MRGFVFLWSILLFPVVDLVADDHYGTPSRWRPDRIDIDGADIQGVARPKQAATLRFLVSGTIAQIHAHEGQLVREGDRLVTLDDRLAQARLRLAELSASRTSAIQQAAIQLKFEEKKLSRLESLHAQQAVSAQEYEAQQASVELARANHEMQLEALGLAEANRYFAEEQLRTMTLFAPFEGVVTELHEKLGASVDPDVRVIGLANLEVLQVELHVPVSLYGMLRVGETARLQAGPPVSDTIPATILSTSPVINASSGTFRCLLEIDNRDTALPGGFAATLLPDAR